MEDQKSPKLVAGERETLLALLQYQRESLVKKVSGVSEEAARRSSVASGTTLLWLTRHLAQAERLWILHRFAGQDLTVAIDQADGPEDTLAAAIGDYQLTWTLTDAVVEARPSLDQLCQNLGSEPPANLRWVLMHLLEETARHAGHADILREMVDGQTGR